MAHPGVSNLPEELSQKIMRLGDMKLPFEAQVALGEIYADVRALERASAIPAQDALVTHDNGSITLDNASVQRLMDYNLLHFTDDGWVVGKFPAPPVVVEGELAR